MERWACSRRLLLYNWATLHLELNEVQGCPFKCPLATHTKYFPCIKLMRTEWMWQLVVEWMSTKHKWRRAVFFSNGAPHAPCLNWRCALLIVQSAVWFINGQTKAGPLHTSTFSISVRTKVWDLVRDSKSNEILGSHLGVNLRRKVQGWNNAPSSVTVLVLWEHCLFDFVQFEKWINIAKTMVLESLWLVMKQKVPPLHMDVGWASKS